MRSHPVMLLGAGLGLVLALSSCVTTTQTTSGSRYLAKVEEEPAARITDAQIVAAANVEPTLTFPARIGLARMDDGRLTALPAEEGTVWRELSERLGPGWGQFIPISPLAAALASPDAGASVCERQESARFSRQREATVDYDCLRESIQMIRLGAARQHLDAVLIYESFGKSQDSSNPLAITKLALIGYFLPTENVEAEGLAQAILVDVRNGYHYGSATATADGPAHRISTPGNVDTAHAAAQGEVRLAAVEALTVEVEKLAFQLRSELEAGDKVEPAAPRTP